MTFDEALKIEIGDVVIAGWDTSSYKKNDELILIEMARHYNGLWNDTGGYFHNCKSNQCIQANIQDFTLKK